MSLLCWVIDLQNLTSFDLTLTEPLFSFHLNEIRKDGGHYRVLSTNNSFIHRATEELASHFVLAHKVYINFANSSL